jgi:hypothetical protein
VKSPHWEDLYNAFEDTFAVRYFWTGQIRYRVEDPAGSGDYAKARAYVLDPDLRIPPRSMRRQARWLVNRTMRLFASSARPDMGRLLKCPECDGGFTIEPDAARCGACGKLVEILEGHVFSFIGGR